MYVSITGMGSSSLKKGGGALWALIGTTYFYLDHSHSPILLSLSRVAASGWVFVGAARKKRSTRWSKSGNQRRRQPNNHPPEKQSQWHLLPELPPPAHQWCTGRPVKRNFPPFQCRQSQWRTAPQQESGWKTRQTGHPLLHKSCSSLLRRRRRRIEDDGENQLLPRGRSEERRMDKPWRQASLWVHLGPRSRPMEKPTQERRW